jgi:hypothetical protein
MKRNKLIKTITTFGCVLIRHGGKQDWYQNPATGISQPVPRHREIGEGLARHIIKMLENPTTASEGHESSGADPS